MGRLGHVIKKLVKLKITKEKENVYIVYYKEVS
jgi:hypothetical protein